MPYDDLPPGAKIVDESAPFSDLPPGAKLVGDYSSHFGEKKAAPSGITPPKPRTASEIFYQQTLRPYVAPLLEITGAVGGAIGGAAVGGFGAPVGAGLGYGTAKGLVQWGDVELGGKTSPPLSEQLVGGLKNVGEGAMMEMGGQMGGKILAKGIGKVRDLWNLPDLKAAKILRDAANTGKTVSQDELQVLLKGAGTNLDRTTAQVTAGVDNPNWQALMNRSEMGDAAYLNSVLKAQEKQSLSEFGRLTPGETQTGARDAMGELKKALTKATDPMREQALQAANVGKINIGSLKSNIENLPTNPDYAMHDVIKGASRDIAEGLTEWADPVTGIIDAKALYGIRKNAVDAAIAKARPGIDQKSQNNLAAKVMAEIKPMIDDAIEGAGGTGWRDYLKTYETGMRDINQKKLTGKAFSLWKKEGKQPFIDLVTGDNIKAVEKILGPGRYDIASELGPSQMDILINEVNKVKTADSIKRQVGQGAEGFANLMKRNAYSFHIPQMLQRETMLTNAGLAMVEKKLGANTMKILTEVSQNPALADTLLDFLPAAERNSVLKYLTHPENFGPGTKFMSTGVVATPFTDKEPVQ